MQPTLVPRPLHRAGWAYEEKVDSYRMLAYKDGEHVRLVSRQGKDFTRRFVELAAAIKTLRYHTLILDGEVARYDEQLVSRFEWMRASPKDEIATPPMFMAFDCLQLEKEDRRGQALRVRRERWETVLDWAPAVLLPVRRLAEHGLDRQRVSRRAEAATPAAARALRCGSRASRQTAPMTEPIVKDVLCGGGMRLGYYLTTVCGLRQPGQAGRRRGQNRSLPRRPG